MLKYILGFLKFLCNPAVSLFCKIDNLSKIDNKAKVNSHTQIYNSSMEKYSYLGRNSALICTDVGRYCSIGDEVKIGLGIHTLSHLSTSPLFTEKQNGTGSSWVDIDMANPYKRVTVGNDVWIGERVMIMGGVNIGDGAVIGAGAIVTKDVPSYAIVAGVPAKVIKYRFSDDIIQKLLQLKWWSFDEESLKHHLDLFQKDDVSLENVRKLQLN